MCIAVFCNSSFLTIPLCKWPVSVSCQTMISFLSKNCSRILLNDEEKNNFTTSLQRPGISSLHKKGILKKVHEKCKKTPRCQNCDEING